MSEQCMFPNDSERICDEGITYRQWLEGKLFTEFLVDTGPEGVENWDRHEKACCETAIDGADALIKAQKLRST